MKNCVKNTFQVAPSPLIKDFGGHTVGGGGKTPTQTEDGGGWTKF